MAQVLGVGTRQPDVTDASAEQHPISTTVRDRECFHDYCDVGAEDSQADHVLPYAEGGLTVQDNGQLACGFHNRLRYKHRGPPAEP